MITMQTLSSTDMTIHMNDLIPNLHGVADVNGIREFVAGMGGRSHYGFGTILPNSVARNSDTYGVLKFTLHTDSYDWQFVPEAGKTYADSGTALCVP